MANRGVAHSELVSQTLGHYCVAEKIGAYKRPRWIEYLAELPKTATGKLQRYKLRELQAQKLRDQASSKPL